MKRAARSLLNTMWIRSMRKQANLFHTALGRVQQTQDDLLARIVTRNADTVYGRARNFRSVSTVRQFQRHVPVTTYEDYLPFLEGIAEGKKHVLTHVPVTIFQPSSGTSSATKCIPYTSDLRADFQRGISPWLTSLYKAMPSLFSGVAYWSISPPPQRQRMYGEIAIGFEDDAHYLGSLRKALHNLVTASPRHLAPDMEATAFIEQTLLCLLSRRDLSLISIWSPSFLTNMLDYFMEKTSIILQLLTVSDYPEAQARTAEIDRLLSRGGENIFEAIWPELGLISCWTHGPCQPALRLLRKYLPSVPFQGKGLIATEAMISLPLIQARDPVLAITSHFFEFRDVESGEVRLGHELREGKDYSVIVTTGGGLYRYALHDIVRVTGTIGEAPTVVFIAKEGHVSDRYGEKINASHVQLCIEDAFRTARLQPEFALLAPCAIIGGQDSYGLFIGSEGLTQEQIRVLGKEMEKGLRQNFHYAVCQSTGQLGPLRCYHIQGNGRLGFAIYHAEMAKRGFKPGDIKPAVLDRQSGWERLFPCRLVD